MKKYSFLILSSIGLGALSFAHHGGNSLHSVCAAVVVVPNPNAPGKTQNQTVALLVDNLRKGADTWYNVVRGVLGLEDYIGAAKDEANASLKVVNTEPEITNDVLFDGTATSANGNLVLTGKLKVDRSSPATFVNLKNTVFKCTDITPLSIPDGYVDSL